MPPTGLLQIAIRVSRKYKQLKRVPLTTNAKDGNGFKLPSQPFQVLLNFVFLVK